MELYRIWKWLPFHNETTEMPQNKTLGYLRDGEQAWIVKFNILFHKVFQIWFLYQEIVLSIDDDMCWKELIQTFPKHLASFL